MSEDFVEESIIEIDVIDDQGDVVEVEVIEVDVIEVDAIDAGVIDGDVLVLDEAVDSELVLPVWEPTGEARVDTALDLLVGLDSETVHGHAEVYDQVHQQLRATLADLDAGS